MRAFWPTFRKHKLGCAGLAIVALFVLLGIYAPLLASSQPLAVRFDGHWYFPLFRYLYYRGFYTKNIDLFFNVMMLILPLCLLTWACTRGSLRSLLLCGLIIAQPIVTLALILWPVSNPAKGAIHSTVWSDELASLNTYAKLELVLKEQLHRREHLRLQNRYHLHAPPTLWQRSQNSQSAHRDYVQDRANWINAQSIGPIVMPLFRHHHWEEDAGGSRQLNRSISWWDRTRINNKDLVASLLFGMRISLMVGLAAVGLSMLIGIPLGAIAGYCGGRVDMWLSRFTEIWESMPTFFMLLMIVAILQQKSILLIVLIMGCFGWTTFCRYLRAEVFKQRNLSYVEACRSQGLPGKRILFRHIIPNALPPILTLLPFSIMNAITREAGLSFLGLGEEGSASWGVLMDEGRAAFPAESYLLWPPAIALTILLVAIALVGDAFRDALDPKLRT